MKILFAASEAAPFVKTGGLGDVAGALPKELVKKGEEVAVVMPYYSQKISDKLKENIIDLQFFYTKVGWRDEYVGIKSTILDGVKFYFIDNEKYFGRDGVYGYFDEAERFAFFQLALIEAMERIDFIPDVLHANDYHTAMIPFLLKEKYHWINAYKGIRTVLTIHNIEFQGQYDGGVLSDLYGVGMERYYDGTVRWSNDFNVLKTGILYADRVNTVSPSYAGEIQTGQFGMGLDQVLRMENNKLSGIVNGIDYDVFNPETDAALNDYEHYSIDNLRGKENAKAQLQARMGLPVNPFVPVIACVSRLTFQKGFHLLLEQFEQLMSFDIQIVLIGTGDHHFEEGFKYFAKRYPEKFSASISFDPKLAQLFYAGADLFLMPSAFEPCGLSQMISMRYGTLPIVHEIGGLKDTVDIYNDVEKTGTGFGFVDFNGYRLTESVLRAINVYYNERDTWYTLMGNAMTADFSWNKSADAYLDLYKSVLTGTPASEQPHSDVRELKPKKKAAAKKPAAKKAPAKKAATKKVEEKPAAKPAAKKAATKKVATPKVVDPDAPKRGRGRPKLSEEEKAKRAAEKAAKPKGKAGRPKLTEEEKAKRAAEKAAKPVAKKATAKKPAAKKTTKK
jgi:starch synthase